MNPQKEIEVVQLIRTSLLRRGEGKDKTDPMRIVTQYWTTAGDLVFEIDPHKPKTE